jgi:hypothetical protein
MERRQLLSAGIFLFVIFFFAFVPQDRPGIVKGKVVPYNAALRVWAVSDKDTASGVVQNGAFEIKNIKPGRYRVIAEGLRPYKVTTKPDIVVNSNAITDVGDIILDQ